MYFFGAGRVLGEEGLVGVEVFQVLGRNIFDNAYNLLRTRYCKVPAAQAISLAI